MDQAVLVSSAQVLVRLLDDAGIAPRAAMWVHNTDTDTWRLWIVPAVQMRDKHAFYRRVAEIVAANREKLPSLDTSDVEMTADSHPAISGLSRAFRVDGLSSVHVSGNTVNGFYLPDGIILRMAV